MSFSESADPLVEAVRSTLSRVEDPEFRLDIVSLGLVEGVGSVEVQLVFEPPWSPEKMSDDARFLLGVYG